MIRSITIGKIGCVKGLGARKEKFLKICNNKRGMSAKFVLDLEKVFGISAEFWVTMQAIRELKNARDHAA